VPEVRDARGAIHQSAPLGSLLDDCQLIVVLTPHACLDWDSIYSRAALVLDTCNSSRGRVRSLHRVLRLGAGWAAIDWHLAKTPGSDRRVEARLQDSTNSGPTP
jgi:hypothetical protein